MIGNIGQLGKHTYYYRIYVCYVQIQAARLEALLGPNLANTYESD